ncbi:hypothetical protein ABPG74_014826 [Tetrahymena malaccensis]
MYHSSLVNQLPSKSVKWDTRSSISRCSNQSKVSSSFLQDRSVSDVKSVQTSGVQSVISKPYKPLKSKRVHNQAIQEEMRNVYEKYNTKQIDEVQLKNELKHKLYIKLNEDELDRIIRNNQFNYKQLIKVCEKDYTKSNQPITTNQEYFQKQNEEKVQHSQNLWQYRRGQEKQKGQLRVDDYEQKKMDDYKEYLKKYQSPVRFDALNKVDQFSKGLQNKDELMKDLQRYELDLKEIKDPKVRAEQNIESTYIKNKILHQLQQEDLSNIKYSPAKNPKQFVENTSSLFKPFNEAENIKPKIKNTKDDENKVIFSSNGIVKLKTLGNGQFCENARDNGNIITWHTSQEDNVRISRQKQQEVEKNRLRKMKSCEFFHSGLESVNNQLVPSVNRNLYQNENQKYDQLQEKVVQQFKQTGQIDKSVIGDIKKQQERCFVYDDYVTPVKINYSHRYKNNHQGMNIITWQ